MKPPVLLDIMVGNRFYTQLRYTKRGFPKMIDGEIVETYDPKDIEDFVYDKLPSLKNKKNVKIGFTSQQVNIKR